MKKKLAIVRGKFLNAYEMQIFEPLIGQYDITAFGSLTSYHKTFVFPSTRLLSPMDLPEFPFKMQVLNRLFIDAHYLLGLEGKLKGFDIVHTAQDFYHYTQQALNAKKKGYVKKVVATVLENIPFNNEGIHGRKEFKKRFRKEIDHVIALTNKTKQALIIEGMNDEKISVVGHGIDTKKFYPIKKKQKSNDLNILFTGRLEKYKGVYEVLYSFKRLLMDNNISKFGLNLTFVGEGSEKQRLIDLEKKLNVERFIKHKDVPYDKMPEIYREADIYIAPSKSSKYWVEQYNTGLLEAQSSGLPIVTTFSGGIPENIGGAGILVQPDDFYSLYVALKDYIINPKKREAYAKKARERAEKIHDIAVIAKKLTNVYENL